jgi:signal transduction histidine kinase/PAS domain-containing protein
MGKEEININGIEFPLDYLAKEKQYADQFLNNSRSMISVINRDYVYEKVNTTFCKAHRGVAEAIVGKSLGDVWGEETFRKKIKDNVDRCFEGATVRYEASFTTPQAGKRFYEVIFRPFSVNSGTITHLLAETFDITDLKLSEKIAIEKEEEFRKFETNLPIGFLRCKPDGTMIHGNKAFLLIMECNSEKSLVSSNLRDYYEEGNLFDIHVSQLDDGKPKSFGRVALKTCPGNDIVCRISGFMNFDESCQPEYMDFAFEDSSRELMLENRLLEAQKLETIGALAGGIAHDFNNILATISGYTELIAEDLSNRDQLERTTKILGAVNKARSLTSQILTFSRQVEQEKVNVNVYEVLHETIAFVKSSVPKQVTLRSTFRDKKKFVHADPTQLFRVFLNLLTNAIQALEDKPGTISITLSVTRGKDLMTELDKAVVADEYVLVKFQDSGKGMDPSLLRRIFEPFFTTREVGKGSGLGLSVVHGIVSEMGGDILVSSEKGKGSEFYVYLPVTGDESAATLYSGPKMKLLLVEGNRHESKILSISLQSAGFEVTMASDLKQLATILAKVESRPNTLIFMGESTRIPIDHIIHSFQKFGIATPCIFITDSGYNIHSEKLINSGIVRQQLIKPVSLKELINAIQLSING